ncbi:MAG: hypothetical protein U0451_01310 [Candidatus Saccharimonadales bacterium]
MIMRMSGTRETRFETQQPTLEPEPVFSLEQMSVLIGNLNTEAKCLAVSFTPQKLVPVTEITENLRIAGAYDIEGPKRFNVSDILKKIHPTIVSTWDDPDPVNFRGAKLWAQRQPDYAGNYVAGLAGALMDYSFLHDRPLRTILGEKRTMSRSAINSTEIRLGLLTGLLYMHNTSPNEVFTREDVKDCISGVYGDELWYGDRRIIDRHFTQLRQARIIEEIKIGRDRIIRLCKKPNGTESYDEIQDLLKIVGEFAIGLESTIDQGISQAHDIIYDHPENPAMLVHRSYASTGHTGKNTR